jgi:hypothetical protein
MIIVDLIIFLFLFIRQHAIITANRALRMVARDGVGSFCGFHSGWRRDVF